MFADLRVETFDFAEMNPVAFSYFTKP